MAIYCDRLITHTEYNLTSKHSSPWFFYFPKLTRHVTPKIYNGSHNKDKTITITFWDDLSSAGCDYGQLKYLI